MKRNQGAAQRMNASADRGRKRGVRRKFATVVERLEERRLLATFHWASNADGNFNDPASWLNQANQPGAPGPNDDATIGFGGINVTVPGSATVNSLSSSARLSVTGGT